VLRYAIASLVLCPGSADVASGPRPDAASAVAHGADLFRIHCANCHGAAGHGDGPTAQGLKVRPVNLTRLARRNGGTFPERAVWSAIDGRDDLLSHGSRAMPIWGLAFQDPETDVGQEGEVRARIGWLVEFLRSIQSPGDGGN
jgi:mono/diheme cytochrome c family protein